ncbi:hypothetical protein EZV62_007777 [Acer yangbiense]|uniref:Uncharacterized protein n=1 Tax=Acer yangbiense TaxID=1000413 RepID=A0A5C7ICG6_9ROSI|nr:hypothetical protein EZV62_007777 [Acer yangbiense]
MKSPEKLEERIAARWKKRIVGSWKKRNRRLLQEEKLTAAGDGSLAARDELLKLCAFIFLFMIEHHLKVFSFLIMSSASNCCCDSIFHVQINCL